MNIDAAKPYLELVAGVANILTIVASTIAIYLYIKNKSKISSAVQLLLNYSFQTTLGEIKEKLERLNEYNANEPHDLMEIRSILHEIAGQINGNPRLSLAMPEMAAKIDSLTQSKKLTEPMRRSIVSEIREKLRNIQVNSMSNDSEN